MLDLTKVEQDERTTLDGVVGERAVPVPLGSLEGGERPAQPGASWKERQHVERQLGEVVDSVLL